MLSPEIKPRPHIPWDKQQNIDGRGSQWNFPIEKQHEVGHPNIYAQGIENLRRMAYEAMCHSGYKVEYFEAEKDVRDLYQDPIITWRPAVVMSCIFDEHPKVKVLKDLGWYSFDDESFKGSVMYLPIYYPWESKNIFDLKDNSLFRVTYFGQPSPAEFRLTDKRLDSMYGTYWVCKLAPEPLDNFVYVTDHGSHYLKRRYNRGRDCKHDPEKPTRVFEHQNQENYVKGQGGTTLQDSKPFEDVVADETATYEQLVMKSEDIHHELKDVQGHTNPKGSHTDEAHRRDKADGDQLRLPAREGAHTQEGVG